MGKEKACDEFVPLVNGGDYRGTYCCTCGRTETEHGRKLAPDAARHLAGELKAAIAHIESLGLTVRQVSDYQCLLDAKAEMLQAQAEDPEGASETILDEIEAMWDCYMEDSREFAYAALQGPRELLEQIGEENVG